MEDINFADNAVHDTGMHGLTDISGVKTDDITNPDNGDESLLRDADGAEKRLENISESIEISVAGAIKGDNGEESVTADDPLEAEFDQLINGKFSAVYKKRTESIVRKRLRSVKGVKASLTEGKNGDASQNKTTKTPVMGAVEKENEQKNTSAQNNGAESVNEQNAIAYAQLRAQNKGRPIENGLRGSCGVVTKINVAALDSSGVRDILRRVGAGEKISFK